MPWEKGAFLSFVLRAAGVGLVQPWALDSKWERHCTRNAHSHSKVLSENGANGKLACQKSSSVLYLK